MSRTIVDVPIDSPPRRTVRRGAGAPPSGPSTAQQRASRWGVEVPATDPGSSAGCAADRGDTTEIIVLSLVDDRVVIDVVHDGSTGRAGATPRVAVDDDGGPAAGSAAPSRHVDHVRRARFGLRPTTKADPYPLSEAYVRPATGNAPRADVPRADVPRADVPRADVPRADVPRADVPIGSSHRAEPAPGPGISLPDGAAAPVAPFRPVGSPRLIASARAGAAVTTARPVDPESGAHPDDPQVQAPLHVGGRVRPADDQPDDEADDEAGDRRGGAMDPRIGARREQVVRTRRRVVHRRVAMVLIGVLVVVAGAVGLLTSPLLEVRTIKVIGAGELGVQRIRLATGLLPGTSMLDVDVTGIRRSVAALPLVEQVSVSRRWPDTVLIEVDESIPVAAMATSDGWDVIDRRGTVLEHRTARPALPLVELETGAVRPEDARVAGALRVAAALTAEMRQRVVRVAVRGTDVNLWMARVDLQTVRSRSADDLLVLIGDPTDLDAKMRAFDAMLNGADLKNAAVLDLSVPDQPIVTQRIATS